MYKLLSTHPPAPGHTLLTLAIGENPDADGLLLLVTLARELEIGYVGERSVQRGGTKDVPIEDWSNAYDVVPVATSSLRSRLLAMTTDGGEGDIAARTLRIIDESRHRYGKPETEPRHPDLTSGKPWPIMTPNPDAEGTAS